MLSPQKTLQLLGTSVFLVTLTFTSSVSFAQGLPSSSFDDYDQARYQQIYNEAEARFQDVANRLSIAERDLSQAQANENQLRQELDQTLQRLQQARGREQEIIRGLEHNRNQIEQTKKQIETITREIGILQGQLNDAKASVERIKLVADGAKAEHDRLLGELNALKAIVEQKQRAVNELSKAVIAQEGVVAKLTQDLANAKTPEETLAIKAKLDAAKVELETRKTAKNTATAELNTAQANVNAKQTEFNPAKARHDAAQAELASAQKRVGDMQTLLSSKQQDLARNQKALADGQARENELTNHLAEVRQRIHHLGLRAQQLDNQVRQAISYTNQMSYIRNQVAVEYSNRSHERDNAIARLNQVNSNIAQAQQSMSMLASSDGGADGRQAGEQLGRRFGQSNGARDGEDAGRSEGIEAGQDREYNTGMNKGLADAHQDAVIDKMKRPIIGSRGSAFEEGKKLGNHEGYQNAYNKAKYAEGRARGLDFGLKRAIEDAKVEEPKGYSAQEQKYLSAKLNEVSLGETVIREGGRGGQARVGGIPDGEERRFYVPRSPTQYESRLNQLLSSFYLPAYDSAFYTTYERVGSAVYQENYSQAHQIARQNAYDREFAKTYPAHEAMGHDEAYLGYAIGNEIGSERKGFDIANAEAYNANIEIERRKAFQAGIERANQLYLNNPVIRIEEITLVENDRDGIYRPSETVQVMFKIKNFGHVAKSDLAVDAVVQSGDATVVESRAAAPAIPGVSFATVTGRQQIRINEVAAEGSSIQLLYKLVDRKELARQTFTKTVQFPTASVLAGFDGVVIPNEATKVNVQLTNRSKSAQSLSVVLNFDGTKISADTVQINVEKLNAGETKTVVFTLTGKPEARFEESEIGIVINQNGLLFGQTGSVVTIIKRHQSTSDSLGLIISKNLARGEGKSLFAKAKMDTWDLRVDGVIGAAQLANYKNKAVHVMADAQSKMDAGSAATLSQFIVGGGQVVIWGSDMEQSQILGQLGSVAFASASRSAGMNDSINGTSTLSSLVASYDGQAAVVKVAGRKARTILSSRFGNLGVQSFANAKVRDQKVGRVYTLGINPSAISEQFVVQLNSLIQAMATPFAQKVEAAAKDANLVNLVLLDIQEEVLFSENEDKDLYLERKDNKIFKALEKMVDKKTAQNSKTQFAQGYKMIIETGKGLSIQSYLENVLDLTAAGGFLSAKTWKNLFCNIRENQNSEYCVSNGGN